MSAFPFAAVANGPDLLGWLPAVMNHPVEKAVAGVVLAALWLWLSMRHAGHLPRRTPAEVRRSDLWWLSAQPGAIFLFGIPVFLLPWHW